MRKIIVSEFVSLDGVMEDPGVVALTYQMAEQDAAG